MHPDAAVHQNAAVFVLIRALIISCSGKSFTMVSQTVQELTVLTNSQTHRRERTPYWKQFSLLRYRDVGGNQNVRDVKLTSTRRSGGSRTVLMPPLDLLVRRNAAIFDLIRAFDHIGTIKIWSWYIKRFKRKCVDKQTNTETNTHTTNRQTDRHYWKQYHLVTPSLRRWY